MTREIRENLRATDLNLEEVNRIFGRLQDRLDELEGRRGTPVFYAAPDLQGNKIVNAAQGTSAGEVLTANLEATDLEISSGNLRVKLAETQGVQRTTEGIAVRVDATYGLTVDEVAGIRALVQDGGGVTIDSQEGLKADPANIDHGSLGGLADDDHTGYAKLTGRSGGQTLQGGTASGDDLTLESTSNSTKGFLVLQPNGGNVGINTSNPGATLDLDRATENAIRFFLSSVFKGMLGVAASAGQICTSSESGDVVLRAEGTLRFTSGGSLEAAKIDSDRIWTFSNPIKPRIYDQSAEPDIPNDSFAFWKDYDDGKYYLILDIGGTQKKVELT